jgi:hypothetical protein
MPNPIFMSVLLVSALQQQAPTTIQRSTGPCSPNIANVTGNVTVNCIGVDPRAVKRLNAQLNQKDFRLAEKIREANQWAEEYKQLEAELSRASTDKELMGKAEEYLHQGELEKAGDVLDEILAREEKDIDRAAANHYNRALVYELQFRPGAALPHLEKAYRYRPRELRYAKEYAAALLPENDFRFAEPVLLASLDTARELTRTSAAYRHDVAWVLNDLAVLYRSTQRMKQAEDASQEALAISRQLAEIDPESYEASVADVLHNLAVIYQETQRMVEAETADQEALIIDRRLAQKDPAEYRPAVAMTLNNLGMLYVDTHRVKEAETAHQEALNIRRQLAKENPAAYQADVAQSLNNLGVTYLKSNRMEEAETVSRESLSIFRELAKSNAAAYLPLVARALDNIGLLEADFKRRKEAETSYDEALDIEHTLAKAEPDTYGDDMARTLNNLGNLYLDGQRMKEAETAYVEALDIRRRLAKSNPATYEPFVAMTLSNVAVLYAETQRIHEAEVAYRESLDSYIQLAKTNPAVYQSYVNHLVQNLLDLAQKQCDHAFGAYGREQIDTAESAWQEALTIFRRLAEVSPDKYDQYVADTLNNLATLHITFKDRSQGAKEVAEALAINRDRWQNNSVAAANDYARSLLISSLVDQKSSTRCQLLREAASIAQNQDLEDLTHERLASCPQQ